MQVKGERFSGLWPILVLQAWWGAPWRRCCWPWTALGGLHGWQWLFLLEGVPAMALGIAIAAHAGARPVQRGVPVARGARMAGGQVPPYLDCQLLP